jgi:signal transduction histidine kinase/ActR/RegA family two-component response regulator
MLVGGVFVWLEASGKLPVPTVQASSLSWWIAGCLVFGTVATLQHVFARMERASLARARAEIVRRRLADEARARANADVARVNAVLEANERRYRGMFESAAGALFEVDLSPLAGLRRKWSNAHPGQDLDAALDASAELLDSFASELRVLDANEQAERLFELPSKDALIGSWDRLFLPATRRGMVALALALDRGESSVQRELEVTTASGRRRLVLFSARRAPSPSELERVVASAVDVTEQRLLEERTRAAQRMETIGRFAGGVAHDFNNALAVIMSWVDLLRRPNLTESTRREGLSAIGKSASRAAQLTRQLMSSGRRDVRAPRPTGIAEAVDEAMSTVSRLLPSDVHVVIEHGVRVFVMADEAQLHQVLLNLAINARDAMPEGGTLRVSTRLAAAEDVRELSSEHGFVELRVQDDGVGMDEATRTRLFEPFFTTKGEGRGTGLGLATVHAIVTDSQGKVTAESVLGSGTTLRVFLPVAEAQLLPQTTADSTAPSGEGRRVLLVEDEAPVRGVMAHILRDAGYDVMEAEGGEAALEIARRSRAPIDVLCTDGILPGLRTDAVIAEFRALFPRGQVLVCSGHVQEELVRRRIADGDCAFVSKPFTMDELLQTVGLLSRRQPGPRSTA